MRVPLEPSLGDCSTVYCTTVYTTTERVVSCVYSGRLFIGSGVKVVCLVVYYSIMTSTCIWMVFLCIFSAVVPDRKQQGGNH